MEPEPPARSLYSPGAIGAFTVFFTPAAGGLAAAVNLRRLGRSAEGRHTAIAGAAITAALIALGALLPDRFDTVVRGGSIGATLGVASWLRRQQKPLYEAHLASGGKKARAWPIALIGSAVLLLLLAGVVVSAVYGSPDTAKFQEGAEALNRKDNPAAEAAFRQAVALDASDDPARYNLAVSIARQGRRDDALEELSKIGPGSDLSERARQFEKRLRDSTPEE